MHPVDWTIIGVYLVWIVWDGIRLTKRSHELEGYFLGGRSLPWWAVGLSVMATQLSAITMIGTTGQGYTDGMRFLQFYYALPIAMIVLSVTLVPFFHNARVYTAYEFLERRFDAKTRAFTSLLFLLSRSMSLGVVISAPAVVLSVVMGVSVRSQPSTSESTTAGAEITAPHDMPRETRNSRLVKLRVFASKRRSRYSYAV